MKIKIRTKENGRCVVLSEDGQPIEGVLRVTFEASGANPIPRVSIDVLAPEIVADVEAEVVVEPRPEKSEKAKAK